MNDLIERTRISFMALLVAAGISLCITPNAFAETVDSGDSTASFADVEQDANAEFDNGSNVESNEEQLALSQVTYELASAEGNWVTDEISLSDVGGTLKLASGQDGFALATAGGTPAESIEGGQSFIVTYSGSEAPSGSIKLMFEVESAMGNTSSAYLLLSSAEASEVDESATAHSEEGSADAVEAATEQNAHEANDTAAEPDSSSATSSESSAPSQQGASGESSSSATEQASGSSTSSESSGSTQSGTSSKSSKQSRSSSKKGKTSSNRSSSHSSSSGSMYRSHSASHAQSGAHDGRHAGSRAHEGGRSDQSSRSGSRSHGSKSESASDGATTDGSASRESSKEKGKRKDGGASGSYADAQSAEAALDEEIATARQGGDSADATPITAISTLIASLGAAGALAFKWH